MPRCSRASTRTRTRTGARAAAVAAALATLPAAAIPALVTIDEPAVDRWFYPFNSTPGTRATMSLFGTTGVDLFDDRDGQILLRWDTSGEIPTGLGPDTYQVVSVRVTITNATDGTVVYDPTVDPYTAYLPDGDPDQTADDPGSPLELFGAAGRNDFDPLTFPEDGPYTPGDPIGTDIRNIKAIAFGPGGEEIDVDNNVRDRFTPSPWAVGTIEGLAPGDPIPSDAVVTFELDLAEPGVRDAIARGLDAGAVPLLVTSLERVVQQGGDFTTIFAKESVQVQLGLVEAATIEIAWETDPCPADADGSGMVDFGDLLVVLSEFGPCDGCDGDVDGSGTVDFSDLLAVLAAFGPCPA